MRAAALAWTKKETLISNSLLSLHEFILKPNICLDTVLQGNELILILMYYDPYIYKTINIYLSICIGYKLDKGNTIYIKQENVNRFSVYRIRNI